MAAAGPTLQELSERAARAEIPLHALVELTWACNLRCEHCYLPPSATHAELSTEDWQRVLAELAAEGCLFLTFTGGEFLQRQDWFTLASYARTLGFGLRLFSNGTLITDAVAEQMAALRPLGVDLSLLGGTAGTHDAITRMPGAFDRMVAGARALRARKVPVMLKTVLMQRNVAEHQAMRALAERLDCQIYFDIEVTPRNDGDPGPTFLCATGSAAVEAARCQIYQGPRALRPTSPADRETLLTCGPCRAGRNTCHVAPNGDVSPCTQWVEPVGNLRVTSFRKIWRQSPVLLRLRRITLADLTDCARCQFLDACSPCLALSLLENGNWAGPAPTKCRSAQVRARALVNPDGQ